MTDSFDEATQRLMRRIEQNWDSRVPVHAASRFYSADPEFWFAPSEWADLGDLAGRDVLHLQCHLGTETIALARRGARVVGLDLSAESLAHARRLAAGVGIGVGIGVGSAEIEYVQANVYDAVEALAGRRFDVVYTGKGALCYLPDLDRWAKVLAKLLRPGGIAYVVEFHPVLTSLGVAPGVDSTEPVAGAELLLRLDYLAGRGARHIEATRTYTDGPEVTGATDSYEWAHGLGEVVTAVAAAGLRVTRLRETDEIPWPRWPWMVPTPTGWWTLPETVPRIPLWYALRAQA